MSITRRLALAGKRALTISTAPTFPVLQEGLRFHCRLDAAKRRNLLLQMAGRRWAALPHILHVGVTTACNLHCPACPTGNRQLGREARHLDFGAYCRVIDEMRGALLFALFWDWGEPFLHPRLPEMIEYAGRSAVHTVISTNGNAGNSEEKIERLVAARPSHVIVCVDGADQATYEKYRSGGRLADVLDTIHKLRRARERLHSQYPLLEFRSLAMRDNEPQFPALLRLAMDSGADLFSLKSLRPYDYRGTSLDAGFVPADPRMSRYVYQDSQADAGRRLDFVRSGPLECAKPHFSPTLDSNGILSFCSYASLPTEHFGDVAAEGFLKVWKSPFARGLRERFERRQGSETCATCYFRTAHKRTILHHVPLGATPEDITVARPETPEQFLAAVAERSFENALS